MNDKRIKRMKKSELLKLISELDRSLAADNVCRLEEKIEDLLENNKEMREEHKKFNMYLYIIESGLYGLEKEVLTQREFILLCQCVHEGRNQQLHKEVFDNSDGM